MYVFVTETNLSFGDDINDFEKKFESAFEELSKQPSTSNAIKSSKTQENLGYDINAAAEVFAAIFADQKPKDVLRDYGFENNDLLNYDSSDLSSCDFNDGILLFCS